VFGQSGIMSHQLSIYESKTAAEFAISFPYDVYLKNIDITDIQTLQKDKSLMELKKGKGDLFLYHLIEKFFELNPVSINDLEYKTAIGETFLNPMKGDWNRDEIYNTIGYYLLGKVALKIQEGIKNEKIEYTSTRIQDLESRLGQHKVFINIEETTKQKITKNLKLKRFKYLFYRLGNKIDEYLNPVTCRLNFSGQMIGLTVFIIFILTLLTRKIILIGFSSSLLIGLLVLGKVLPSCSHNNVSLSQQNKPIQTKIKLNPITSYHEIDDNKDYAINIYSLNEDGEVIGECIWMEKPHFKANYFSYDKPYDKFSKLKETRKPVFAATGGYTNKKFPVGLTIDKGVIVNVSIKHDMDGLVIVTRSGDLYIFTLDMHMFQLPLGGPKILNPLNNLIAFSELLEWAKQNKVTLFQSHMFAYNNQVTMSPTRSDPRLRERRLLTLCSDPKTGKEYQVIFNLTSTYTQYTASQEILSIMKNHNKKVEGIINLDTGTFNIMQIFDVYGKVIKSAPNNIEEAANLLVFTI